MKTIIASIATVGMLMSVGTALAQDAPAATTPEPATQDTDTDQLPDRMFATVDTDKNGAVSWPEFELIIKDVPEEQYKAADADGSGDLNEEEYNSLIAAPAGQQ